MKLNLGCGKMRLPGYVGVDFEDHPGVDVVFDLTKHPWPFPDNSVDRIVAWHFLEHLPGYELSNAMREIHRILMPGGEVYVKVPYREKGPYNPFHFHVFDRTTFDAWVGNERFAPGQQHDLFVRRKQDVVVWAGFPLWHLKQYAPWLLPYVVGPRRLLHQDERSLWTRLPFPGRRELREWLVKR